jgi:hypothetical protein
VSDLQADILAELRAIRVLLEAREERARTALRAQDAEYLRALLPVLAARYRDGCFTVGELMEAATERSPAGADLRLVIGSRKAQSLGKLLERAVGHVIAGIAIERAGAIADGVLWRCIAN